MLTAGCNTTTNTNEAKRNIADETGQKKTIMNDTTPKVTGIGGIFFRSKNPQETREWYGRNPGLWEPVDSFLTQMGGKTTK